MEQTMQKEALSESVMDTLNRINSSYGRGSIRCIVSDEVGNYSAWVVLQYGLELARIAFLPKRFIRFRGQTRKIRSDEEFYRNR